MRVVRIKTTAFEEEDFYLLTTLNDNQIVEVIKPINDMNNEYLFIELTFAYPTETIVMYNDIETLKI